MGRRSKLPSKAAAVTQTGAATTTAAPVSYANETLARFTGSYYSDELDATFRLATSGSNLLLTRARSGPDTLRATAERGAFRVAGLTLRFDDAPGAASSFTLDGGRVRGIEFRRMAPGGR
jgi:hypothetical protein